MAPVATSTSPFLSIRAAAQALGISVGAVRQRITTGTLAAYQFGRTWFIPTSELHPAGPPSRGRWTMTDADTIAALTAGLPDRLTIEDLERFFGLRRPWVFDVLRAPGLSSARDTEHVTTKALLVSALWDAANARAVPMRGREEGGLGSCAVERAC